MRLVEPEVASRADLLIYHDEDYVDALLQDDLPEDEWETHGLVYDAEWFPQLGEYVTNLAGGTLTACRALAQGECSVSVHLDGGRHHAHKDRAAGFCYVNDCVLGILCLQSMGFARVLYVDVDVHHGDGVQEAFYYSSSVLCISFHRLARGFYPGTGFTQETGGGHGKGYTINVPLDYGTTDAEFVRAFDRVMASEAVRTFGHDAIVLQCGVDGLAQDDHHEWQLTSKAYTHCLQVCMASPLVLLGGGGYNVCATALCYADMLCSVLGVERGDIPPHDFRREYFSRL
jgi:histone deacetylase 8